MRARYPQDNRSFTQRTRQVLRMYFGTAVVVCLLTLLSGVGVTIEALADVPVTQPLSRYENTILNSGGVLLEEQSRYDVQSYDIDLYVDPSEKSIYGSVITRISVLEPTDKFVAHLDTVFATHRVMWVRMQTQPVPLEFRHEQGLVIAQLPEELQPGDVADIEITYSGSPRQAPNPPWEGGFTWAETEEGITWVGVSCQMNGADIWWPVKDHPSDRPESVSMKVTVPDGLTALSNGVLQSVEHYTPTTSTFHWHTDLPINSYAVTLNIGPYDLVSRDFESITGEVFPIYFWTLPANIGKARELMDQVVHQMEFFERLLGPYPFRSEKYGIAEAPFLGMEHQTLIAYGAGYRDDVVFETDSGFDDLHHHELAHEWWGNMIAVYDWKDFWIHEGFATYMQPLYAEELHGKDQYRYFMQRLYERISNNMPIAPVETRTTREMFEGRDIYMKGAWVLHSLRKLIGDEPFFTSLRQMLYPDPELEKAGVRPPSRLVDTDEFIAIAEQNSGRELDWFFETYLRHADLPELEKRQDGDVLYLSWNVPGDIYFPMPVEVFDGKELRVIIPEKDKEVKIFDRSQLRIDPDGKVLRSDMFDR
ncbi:M1 family metallopeptidase [Balneolales bacterium ANBcel1]|nr:M1 family metallopeptidase [Balneolales bacterium ANBcel1]